MKKDDLLEKTINHIDFDITFYGNKLSESLLQKDSWEIERYQQKLLICAFIKKSIRNLVPSNDIRIGELNDSHN